VGAWGFVLLAYGIVWGGILVYLVSLKRRLRCAEEDLLELRDTAEFSEHAKK
jgi:CcmD family protein